ncbi:MAG: hypothetical protein ACFFCW_20525 [Candidatus Hodarchaeota archaeon]
MLEQHFVICGDIETVGANKALVHKLKLGKDKHKGQIYLDIDSITEKMVQDLPDVMHDLLEIATYVYVGDQIVSRGGERRFDYGKKWHRCLNFKIPVRENEIWSDPEIRGLLEEALSFVSGDTYTFDFVPQSKDAFPGFLNFRTEIEPRYEYNQVLLFSGGLDSFTGAIEEILGNKNCPVLVSHQSNYKLVSLQRKLHEYLLSLCESGPEPLHVPVMINKEKRLTRETSQRTRSFLYASLGTIVASIFGLNCVRFYENGVISCNLSFDGQTPQARSTRVTHPKFLSLLSRVVSAVLDHDFYFENPYFSKTRTGVCLRLKELHHERQISATRSCAKAVYVKPETHCGTCFQCIGRRFATLASKCQDYDPQLLYALNIFTDNLDNIHDRAMAAGFAGFATRLDRMTLDDFVIRYSSEVHEITGYIPSVSREEAMRALFKLHRRHAQKVNGVLDASIAENISSIRKGLLPDTCLLSMVARKEHLDIDKLFKKRKEAGKKHAKGELEKKVSNLLDQDHYMSAQEIANRIGNTTADAIRHTMAWKKKHRKR